MPLALNGDLDDASEQRSLSLLPVSLLPFINPDPNITLKHNDLKVPPTKG